MTDLLPPGLHDLSSAMMEEAMATARKRVQSKNFGTRYQKWQGDPVGFGETVLGETYTEDIKDVMRSVVDNRVTIARSCNASGKTHALARIAVWFFLVYPGSKVFTTAAPPLENLRNLMWGEIMGLVQKHPNLFVGDKLINMRIERNPNRYLVGVTIPMTGSAAERESKFSGKHSEQLLFLVDEGDAVPEEVYKGIESCMSSAFARLLITFNPRERIGSVYDKERNKTANVITISAFNHPNVIEGREIIPGAVDRATTLRRVFEWTRALQEDERVDDECFKVPDYLVGTSTLSSAGIPYDPLPAGYRKIVEFPFFHMVLGEYPAKGEHQLIAEQWINDARLRWDAYVAAHGENAPVAVSGLLGVDVAELGGDYNAAVARYGGFVRRPKRWAGLDVYQSSVVISDLQREWRCETAMVDGDGVGAGVAPIVDRRGNDEYVAFGVKVSEKPHGGMKAEFGEFFALKDQLQWSVREWLRTDPQAMLPPDAMLVEELLAPRYKVDDRSGKIVVTRKDDLRKILRRSPDSMDALCLTFAPYRRAKVRRLYE